jgi:glycosyltransferase involved in cell wall biosynthesis
MTRSVPVTVIVPAYQAAPFIEVALRSLQQQTAVPEQVVVVDDGSTDDTAAIAERLGATVVRQQQRGPGAARNRGLQEAKGDFVAFLDADDWYAPDKLDRSVNQLRQLGAACIASDAWLVRGDRVEGRKNDGRTVPVVLTQEFLLRGNPIICSSVVARRTAVEEVGCFDEAPDLVATEDYDLWLRLAQREPIAYLAQPMTFYRAHPGSLSANSRFLRGVERILQRHAAQHPDRGHFANLIRRRRADVRLDLAWDLLAEGRSDEAQKLIREAQDLARSWRGYKLAVRSRLRFL